MITYSKANLKVAEVFFNEAPPTGNTDILRYQACRQPIAGVQFEERHTILIPLASEEDALFRAMNATTRTQISRGERDKVSCSVVMNPGEDMLGEFAAFWALFAPLKGLPPLNMTRLEGMRSSNALVLAHASSEAGEVLVWHCHVRTGEWARLVHSASLYRESRQSEDKNFPAMVSRANRLLHWREMREFRAAGLNVYDFGGWYNGQDDQGLLNVNRFKEGFGGEIVPVYYAERGMSLRGSMALGLRRLLKKDQKG